MASYRGPFLGQELDRIFLDIENHVPERWAVGQVNGVDVGADDETHENNAKYYAQQAGTFAEAIEGDAEAAQAAAAIAQSIAAGNVLFYDYADNKQYYIAFGASADGYPMITLEEVS